MGHAHEGTTLSGTETPRIRTKLRILSQRCNLEAEFGVSVYRD